MRFLSVNSDCFLIELSGLDETLTLYRSLLKAQLAGVKAFIPAAKTILVFFNPFETDFKQLHAHIASLKIEAASAQQLQAVIVPICYDGEDLANVAELQGLTVAEVIAKHQQALWNVAFIGFAPGFAYLSSPDHPFGPIPRLSTPRKKIVAGSLGLAGQYSGIYPKDSPGGWQLIGTTSEKMWDLQREQPALLLPGMQVHFEDVSRRAVSVQVAEQIQAQQHVQALESSVAEPAISDQHALFKIIAPSLQMLFQDEGRFQHSRIGVGCAGAMDVRAMHSANRIVGNPSHQAVIEVLNGGLKAKMQASAVIAVSGAISNIQVKFADGQMADFASYQAIALDQDDEFHIQTPTAGLRNYLAVRGGMHIEPVLNSCSFDSLAVLGPAPLKMGDVIYSGHSTTTTTVVNEVPPVDLPQVGDTVMLDIVMGPRSDWFDAESVARLCQQAWLVSNDSNRVGLRLVGEQALSRSIEQELESEGTCVGALQIPPSGQPVLFMKDHPLTGGYPVIAAVAKHHWDLVAQIPAACQIKFRVIAEQVDIENKDHE